MNPHEIIDFVNGWRRLNLVAEDQPLTDLHLTKFALALQERIAAFASRPIGPIDPALPAGPKWSASAILIPYSGSIGKWPAWEIAAAISGGSNGQVFFGLLTPQAELLNSTPLRAAMAEAIGGANSAHGAKVTEQLFDGGRSADGTRSPYAFGKVLALTDFVAINTATQSASGDVRTLTVTEAPDSVFVQSELPALLSNSSVTAINRVPKPVYQAIYDRYRATCDHEKSIAEVAKAVAASSYSLAMTLKIGTKQL